MKLISLKLWNMGTDHMRSWWLHNGYLIDYEPILADVDYGRTLRGVPL